VLDAAQGVAADRDRPAALQSRFITTRAPIAVDYEPGTVEVVEQHDSSVLRLRKVARDCDLHNRIHAMTYLQERHAAGELVTGLLYLEPESQDLHEYLGTVEKPFNELGEAELIPGNEALQRVNQSLR
jgi:2-oxoglutarate ferredoxin oxidoreductase subunit beta